MNQQTCELCGTAVRVVGKTTRHYEPLPCAECADWKRKASTQAVWSGELYDKVCMENRRLRAALTRQSDMYAAAVADATRQATQVPVWEHELDLAHRKIERLEAEVNRLREAMKDESNP